MAEDKPVAERPVLRGDAAADRYRADREQRPKTVTRPPADKMARPGARRGYETK